MAGLDAPNCTFVTTLSCEDVHPSHSNFCACCSVLSNPNPLVANPAMLPHLSQSISQRAGVSHSWYPPQPAIQLLKLYLYRYKYTTNTIQMHNKYNTNITQIRYEYNTSWCCIHIVFVLYLYCICCAFVLYLWCICICRGIILAAV